MDIQMIIWGVKYFLKSTADFLKICRIITISVKLLAYCEEITLKELAEMATPAILVLCLTARDRLKNYGQN